MSVSVVQAIARCVLTHSWAPDMCDNFVANMYGFTASGYNTALDNWNAVPAPWNHPGDSAAPTGMLMFWGGGQGHVAIADGIGGIFSTDISGTGTVSRVPWTLIGQRWGKPYLGWTVPYFQDTQWDGSSMTRIMRDSTAPADIPTAGTDLVAGYLDGSFAWPSAGWARFTSAPHVTIDVNGTRPDADVLDVETGDATPSGSVVWIRKALAVAGRADVPVLYCNQSNRPAIIADQSAAGFAAGRDYKLWVATLDGTQTLSDMTGVVAVQYAGEALTGHHYDQSIVVDDTWKAGDMPLTAADKTWIVSAIKAGLDAHAWDDTFNMDRVPAPVADSANPTWTASNYLRLGYVQDTAIKAQAATNGAALSALKTAVDALTAAVTAGNAKLDGLGTAAVSIEQSVTNPGGFVDQLVAQLQQLQITITKGTA